MRNRYLDSRRRRMMDGRNPYGSQGGYVTSHRRARNDYSPEYDMGMDRGYGPRYESDRTYMDSNYYSEPTYQKHMGTPGYNPMMDYGREPYYRGMNDYAFDKEMLTDEYKQLLKEWIGKLKSKDRYGMTQDQLIKTARNMGAKFDKYTEDEFYAAYLMMASDYKDLTNDPMMFIKMAKDFFEDDDIAVSPSEKLCIYLYEIVLGKVDE